LTHDIYAHAVPVEHCDGLPVQGDGIGRQDVTGLYVIG
jgi:hypothetical protein